MKQSTLVTLTGVSAVVLIAAFFVTSQRGSYETAQTDKGPFYVDLKPKIETLDKLKVISPTKKLDFVKKGDLWIAPYKYDHPANAMTIQKLFASFVEMKKTEEKTKKPEAYSALGVEDVLKSDSRGFRVEGRAGEAVVFNLHVGARAASGGDAFYVRKAGEEQVYQIKGDLALKDDEDTWLVTEILDIDKARIMAVDFTDKSSDSFSVKRINPKDTSFELSSIPAGRKIKSPYAIDMAARGLEKLTFRDVAPMNLAKFEGQSIVTFRCYDGLKVEIFYVENIDIKQPANPTEQQKGWLKFVASLDEAQLEKNKSDKAKIQAEIDKINKRVSNWVYHLPSYKLDQLKRSIESMLEPVEKKDAKKK